MMNDEQENTKELLKEDLAEKEPNTFLEPEIEVQNFDQTISSLTLPKHLLETEDWTTEAPDSNVHEEKKQDKWKMPPPIFRVNCAGFDLCFNSFKFRTFGANFIAHLAV